MAANLDPIESNPHGAAAVIDWSVEEITRLRLEIQDLKQNIKTLQTEIDQNLFDENGACGRFWERFDAMKKRTASLYMSWLGNVTLNSVGSIIAKDGMVYPLNWDDSIDLDNGVHVNDIDPSGDWWNSLSWQDKQTYEVIA